MRIQFFESVERMDPSGEDVVCIPRPVEGIDLLCGVFLKSVYFLDESLIKSVIVGVYKNRGNSLGISFKGRRGYVYWSYDTFNQFAVRFNEITIAIETKSRCHITLESGKDIKVTHIFGNIHVFLCDGEHTITLKPDEWSRFINSLPMINREVRDLFMDELLIRQYITSLLSDEDHTTTLIPRRADVLFDEVEYYNRWSNGGGG